MLDNSCNIYLISAFGAVKDQKFSLDIIIYVQSCFWDDQERWQVFCLRRDFI